MRNVLWPGLILVSSLFATAQEKDPPKRPPLPRPYDTQSASFGPRLIPRPENAELKLPHGFHVHVYAEGFKGPRFMAEGPNKEIVITDTYAKAVYVLLDEDKNYRAESKRKLVDGLDRPYGLAFWSDYLYIAESSSLKRYRYDAKSMSVCTPGEEVVSMKGISEGHWTRTVLFDRQDKKMYLTIGSRSNVAPGEDPRRAAVHRYNPDGSGQETFATGLRNVVGLRWYPGTDALWGTVQERDLLGDDLVPDYFTRIDEGGFYGWPYAYVGPNEDPRNQGLRPDLVKKTIVPNVFLGAHVAVLDMLFYTGNQFPSDYHGGAFLAFHGSWNRSRRTGYSVAFIPFQEGKPLTGPQDFLTGFMLGPDKREVWGRPVGLFQMQDGSLLVSEDGDNKVWRIFYE